MTIHTKSEIVAALNKNITSFNQFILPMDKETFETTPGGKWSAGQNLDHLIRSIRPLQPAYGLPKFILRIMFGKTNRPSRTYDEVVTKYKNKLAAGGRASGAFIPPAIPFDKKETLLKKYEEQKQKLISKIEKQTEKELDEYILPHPLLGKVTLREMLYFTIHHNEHHLELLKSRG
jgi:hypothetical protein